MERSAFSNPLLWLMPLRQILQRRWNNAVTVDLHRE